MSKDFKTGISVNGDPVPTRTSTDTLQNKNLTSGTNTFPTFNQNTTGTASNVTGTVAIANGGTNAITAASARTNLSVAEASGFAKITVGTVTPSSPSTGDLWVDTN